MRPLALGIDQPDSLQPGLVRQPLRIGSERTRRKVKCRLTYEVETLRALRPGVTLRREAMEMQIILQYLDAFALLTLAVSKVLATITDHSLWAVAASTRETECWRSDIDASKFIVLENSEHQTQLLY